MQTMLLSCIGRHQSALVHDPAYLTEGYDLSRTCQYMFELTLTVYTPVLIKCSPDAFFRLGFVRSPLAFVIVGAARNAKASA